MVRWPDHGVGSGFRQYRIKLRNLSVIVAKEVASWPDWRPGLRWGEVGAVGKAGLEGEERNDGRRGREVDEERKRGGNRGWVA